jgi:ATP-binding cassette subfamily B protein
MSLSNTDPIFSLNKKPPKNHLVGLWRLLKGYRLTYFSAIFTLAISAIAKTSTYLLLRYLIDTVLGKKDYSHLTGSLASSLLIIAAGFLLLAIIEGGFAFLSGRFSALTAENIARRLRNFLFDHIQQLPFVYHNQMQTGELIQRSTSDVDAVRRFFADQAIGVGRIILLFTINFIAIIQLNWQLALISIVTIPLIVVASAFFFSKVRKAYEKYQEQDARLSTTLQENLTGVRVVKAFARQSYEKDKFESDNKEKYIKGRQLLMMHSLFWPVSDVICGFQMLGGFFTAAIFAINQSISVGTYLAYAGLVVWLIWPMRNLGRLIVQTSTGMVSFGRVMEIIKQEREPLDEGAFLPKADVAGEIVFSNVNFEYEADHPTLSHINFTCKPGQVIALLGPTGSGKSTLVNLLPRFFEYTSGSLTLDGVELKDYSRRFLRSQIGIVEQEPFLFSRSIRENITYGVKREISQDEIEQAAKAAAINNAILAFPKGYDTLVGEKGVTLSGGQKQRVAIARTILKNPRILILDDSTSSVDTETEAAIREALNNLMENRTTFIIAHRIQSLMTADFILVLDKGHIVQKGKHQELIEQDGIYKQIYDIQTRIETELENELATVTAD